MIPPRIELIPESTSSAGPDICELCDAAGLVLDDWQRYVMENAMGEREDGSWAAFQVGLLVPRQQGKSELAVARMLAGLFLLGEQLIVFSAHEVKTAQEIFLRVRNYIDRSSMLSSRVEAVRLVNGEQEIRLKTGQRLKFLARSTGAGRGFSCDCLILDEAYALTSDQLAAIMPTMSARENPQMWIMSSAGLEFSDQLKAIRDRGIAGDDKRLAFFEWSADPKLDAGSIEAWRQANPAIGIRLTEEFIALEYNAMPEIEFKRERLGHWDSGLGNRIIDEDTWAALCDPDSKISTEHVFAFDVAPGNTSASIAVAGRRDDGRVHVEIVEHRSGTHWLVDRLISLWDKYSNTEVVVDPGSPAGGFIPALQEREVDLLLINARDLTQACSSFHAKAMTDTLRHIDQPALNAALDSAVAKPLGDGWKFTRRESLADITPIVAATLASRGFENFIVEMGGALESNIW